MTFIVVIIAFTAIAFSYHQSALYLRRRRFCRQHQCHPAVKYPQWERILGLGLTVKNYKARKAEQLLEGSKERFRQMGNTYSATTAGIPTIFTIEPDNIKTILAEKFDDFDAGWLRRRAFAPSIGDVLITADGPRWHHQRSALRPAFKKQQFSDFSFYKQDIEEMLQQIPTDGSTIDLAPVFYTLALMMASKLLFDESIASLNPRFVNSSAEFLEAFRRVNHGNQRRIALGALLSVAPRDLPYEAGCKVIHNYGNIFVEKAMQYRESWSRNDTDTQNPKGNRYSFLQEIAKEIEEPLETRNHLLGMLLVGSETTASLLAGCLHLLSSRPKLWNDLREQALALGEPDIEGVSSFTALRHFVNEVLRLYPILPLFGRMANKDTFLPLGGGAQGNERVFVPKGTLVMINTHCLHRREDVFGSDANEFKPERWASMKTSMPWSYLPFGGGPRICLGQQFAVAEVSYTLIRLLQAFPFLESRDPRPWRESIGISSSNGNGARVAFRTGRD